MMWFMQILRIYLEVLLLKKYYLTNKAFNIAKHPKTGGYERGLASVVSDLFDMKSSEGAATCAQSETLATQNRSMVKIKL